MVVMLFFTGLLLVGGFFVSTQTAHADITSNLVGHWTFDEGYGISVADSSGNSNTGTLSGATKPTWTTGNLNGGLLFLQFQAVM